MKLTKLERLALDALRENAMAVSGGDFALLEEVRWPGDRRQLGGLVSSLASKGVIESVDTVKTEQEWTQVVIASAYL